MLKHTLKAEQNCINRPWWAEPLPLPPAYDALVDVERDRKLAAVMCFVARVAKQRGTTFTQQVEIWKGVIE